jgi:opacity protein-like surface antigen
MTKCANRRVGLLALVVLLLVCSPSRAETYVAGQVGASIPNKFSNVEGVDSLAGLKFSDLSLQNSFMYGGKLGYYFDSVKWLGIETEVFNTNPNLKQQNVTVTAAGIGAASGSVIGQHVRVLNWAPINVVVRYPGERFQPYAGVGMGVFFARIHDSASGESSSDTKVGLNTQLGLRFLVTQHVALFGEWKYNRASFNFSDSTPTAATGGLKGDYSAHILAFGLGYHF